MKGISKPPGLYRLCCVRHGWLAAVLLVSSCQGDRGDEAARWQHLTEGFHPSALFAEEVGTRDWLRTADGRGPLRLVAGASPDAVRVELDIERDDWIASAFPHVWWTQRPLFPEGLPAQGEVEELLVEGRSLELLETGALHTGSLNAQDWKDECFATVGARLYLAWRDGEPPPERAVLRVHCERGELRDGRWRVTVGRHGAEGLPVWPGQRETLRCDIPPQSALRFSTVVQEGTPGAGQVVFRVRLDEELLFEAPAGEAGPRVCSVELPAEGRRGAQLAFEVDGPAALSAFLNPRITPLDVGSYAQRPWEASRPSIVLFVADTFRADSMQAYGGDEALTPYLDAFAERCVLFERAWSPSSWTLPAQVSMMTGLFPYQHGATRAVHALPGELVTIAEHLREAGYRTGAVTDKGYVTRAAGMDHGFEWFDQHWGTLEDTLASVGTFLEADDGRPVFLFVQTYETHTPYLVSDETREQLAGRFEFGDFTAIEGALVPDPSFWLSGGELTEERRRALEGYRDLYLGTVFDLDRGFGLLLEMLEERGLSEHGYVMFTSDHGEAFYEHQTLGHGVGVWEEIIRIPLLLSGPGLTPRRVRDSVSLVDLPRSLCTLAGLPPREEWLGRSLLSLDADRPVFSFECNNRGGASAIAMIEGDRKLLLPLEHERWSVEELLAAYDLARDPGESVDLSAGEGWPAELLERLAEPLRALVEPRALAAEAEMGADELRNLSELGYF